MYRINDLLKSPQMTFHTRDLATIWRIKNNNTLYTTIKRYINRGILIPIHKGFYSKVPLTDLDPVALGISYLHSYAYLSTETVLAQEGVISQAVYPITLISGISKKFTLGNQDFLSRRLPDNLLYHTDGITEVNGVLTASKERAMKDMLHFNPNYHFGNTS